MVGISSRAFDAYWKEWRHRDPVQAAVLDRQVAVHGGQIAAADIWKQWPIYTEFARPLGIFHYMAAPLYGGGGQLIGVVNVCRAEHLCPFQSSDLRVATTLAGYLSAMMARLSTVERDRATRPRLGLTKREREVVHLVTRGENNLQIAATLRIARETVKKTLQRVYRKLDVNGRAQMVARVVELGFIVPTLESRRDNLAVSHRRRGETS
jgi:DNA-binding CsgD family transcriptional regulator